MDHKELELTILRKADTMESQKTLANELGYSVGKINYVLNALIDKGFIKAENFATAENKKKYKYLLTAKGMKEKIQLTEKFIARKKREYNQLQRELRDLVESK
ncbi:MAG: MarR family EPS-associated transcriptional regulator [Candidatus Marinimicrobia bacterium]|nr:MarR family EPS-associated transcriptional regulator [Candidatus Neomarinimicrobiota bacterium]